MTTQLPQYDELYVISDIHMGGERSDGRDFQIFNRGDRLANFIRYVATVRADDQVALVLNGDIIDSLAEDTLGGYVALDSKTALDMTGAMPSTARVSANLGGVRRSVSRMAYGRRWSGTETIDPGGARSNPASSASTTTACTGGASRKSQRDKRSRGIDGVKGIEGIAV